MGRKYLPQKPIKTHCLKRYVSNAVGRNTFQPKSEQEFSQKRKRLCSTMMLQLSAQSVVRQMLPTATKRLPVEPASSKRRCSLIFKPAGAMAARHLTLSTNRKLWQYSNAGTLLVSWREHRIAKYCVTTHKPQPLCSAQRTCVSTRLKVCVLCVFDLHNLFAQSAKLSY
jgi:hypothetical protein